MRRFSIKLLGVAILAFGIVITGTAFPANAAAGVIVDPPVPTFYETSSSPAFTITVEHNSTITAGSSSIFVRIATLAPLVGCSLTQVPSSVCGITNVVAAGGGTISSPTVQKLGSSLLFGWSGTTSAVTITFAPGAFQTSTPGTKTLTASAGSTSYTTTINVASGSAPVVYSATFIANGANGTMTDQSASSATALSANAFTRSGYSFAGWNTSADGSGVSYADGASYAFTSSTTLYAQWTADTSESSPSNNLANTGIDSMTGISLLAGGLSLGLVGAEMFMIARRKRSN